MLVWIPEISTARRPTVLRPHGLGGKGANLLRLQENGFDVPLWLCILAPGLGETLRANHLLETVQRRLETLPKAPRSEVEQASTELRDLVGKMRLPASIRDPLIEGLRRIADGQAVAVRSSAEGEDGVRSSASGL